MIGDFENTTPNLYIPPECKATNNLNYIANAFFWKRGFDFASFTLFADVDEWIQAIKDLNIIPVFRVKMYEDISEETLINKSSAGYSYEKSQGKYMFKLTCLYPIALHKNLIKIKGVDYDFSFSDRNGNLVAYSPDNIKVTGFEVDMINTAKLKIGNDASASIDLITLELAKPEELDNPYIIAHEWSMSRLKLVPVVVFDIVEGSLEFSIKDVIYNLPISGLSASDISIVDETGTLPFTTLANQAPGDYVIDGITGTPTVGNIVVDSSLYYGNGLYIFAQTAVTITNLVFETLIDVDFDVTVDLTGSPATGMVITDFTVNDDVGGVVAIGIIYETSPGHYRLDGLSTPLVSGVINIDSTEYLGSIPYIANIDLTIYNIESIASDMMSLSVSDAYFDPVVDLIVTDFEFVDVLFGTLTIASFTNEGSGNYSFEFDSGRASGSVSIDSVGGQVGSTAYDFTDIGSILNGGESATTIFLDSDSDGIANYFEIFNDYLANPSIVSGSGAWNAQRLDLLSDITLSAIQSHVYYFKANQDYQIRLRYTSSRGIKVTVTDPSLVINTDDDFGQDSFWNTETTTTFTTTTAIKTITVKVTTTGTFTSANVVVDLLELIEV